jgi:plastocyanin
VSVGRSVTRILLAVALVTAGGIAWAEVVAAAGKEINATSDPAKCDKTWGPPCFAPSNGTVTQINQGDTVTWKALDGTHTVTPADGTSFAGSDDLTGPDGTFSVTFDKPGTFSFYCKHHGSVEDGGKIHHGMWGKIEVKAADTTTTTGPPAPPPDSQPPPSNPNPNPPPPPAPPPTHPPSPPPTQSNGSTGGGSNGGGQTAAGTGRPFVGPPPTQAAPPPTKAASSGPPETQPPTTKPKEKDREGGDNVAPPEATVVPPDAAVLPPSPQFPTATTAPLAVSPAETPHGDTIAVLKNEPGGRKRKLVMFLTIFGFGAFAAGVGGWKYVNRPSKYWPA